MDRRRLGRTDMEVSPLGFGAAEIGFEGASAKTVARLLSQAIDAGLNVIDTAECYEKSEELIGAAVASRRAEYYLFTKCGHARGYPGDWSKDALLRSIERSLKRLQTNHLDLVQLHSCAESELRRGDVIAALVNARERGYTRYIGYSGDGGAAAYAVQCAAFDVLQTSVNIADQEALETIVPSALTQGMGIIAKRPIANVAWRYAGKPDEPYHVPYWDRLRNLRYDFLREKPPIPVQTALRFTLSVPGVHTAIVGTARPDRWMENARLLDKGPLTTQELEAIRTRWREVRNESWVGQT
jgi:aryl-alcohol dehydrogenase-like predicted oxidoreductase